MVASPSPLARGPQWQLDDTVITRIAVELAREMYTPEEVFARFNLDANVFRTRVRNHPAFERAFLEAKAVWSGTGGARERVAIKAGMLFEDWLAEADSLFHDKNQPLSSKVELLKQMSKVAGFEQSEKQATLNPGDRVVVQINLGAGGVSTTPLVIDKVAPMIDVTAAPEPLPEWNTPQEQPSYTPPTPAVVVLPEPNGYMPPPVPEPPPVYELDQPAQVTRRPKLQPFTGS